LISELFCQASSVPALRTFQVERETAKKRPSSTLESSTSLLSVVNLFDVHVAQTPSGILITFSAFEGPEYQASADLIRHMFNEGITVPERPVKNDTRSQLNYWRKFRDALVNYKQQARITYRHQASSGNILDQLQREIEKNDRILASPTATKGMKYEAAQMNAMLKHALRSAPAYLEGLARENPGTMPQDDVRAILDYLTTKNEENERRAVQAFDRLRRTTDPKKWQVTNSVLSRYFPTEGSEKPNTWATYARVENSLPFYDLMSRLSSVGPETVVGQGEGGVPLTAKDLLLSAMKAEGLESEPATVSQLLSDEGVRTLIIEQSQLSLDEMSRMLEQQSQKVKRRGREGGHLTIQASSAICKLKRRKRTVYQLPKSISQALGPHLKNSVIILMSPSGPLGDCPRVMTWRRGYHIDCDLTGTQPFDLSDLLGKAIQSAMYWVAEKPKKRAKGPGAASIYLARVGDAYIYKLWDPSRPLTLETITEAMKGSPNTLPGVDRQFELEAYSNALDVIGFDSNVCGNVSRAASRPKATEGTPPKPPPTAGPEAQEAPPRQEAGLGFEPPVKEKTTPKKARKPRRGRGARTKAAPVVEEAPTPVEASPAPPPPPKAGISEEEAELLAASLEGEGSLEIEWDESEPF